MKEDIIARSINGVDYLRFKYVEETGFYHWEGQSNYAGFTKEELLERQ